MVRRKVASTLGCTTKANSSFFQIPSICHGIRASKPTWSQQVDKHESYFLVRYNTKRCTKSRPCVRHARESPHVLALAHVIELSLAVTRLWASQGGASVTKPSIVNGEDEQTQLSEGKCVLVVGQWTCITRACSEFFFQKMFTLQPTVREGSSLKQHCRIDQWFRCYFSQGGGFNDGS